VDAVETRVLEDEKPDKVARAVDEWAKRVGRALRRGRRDQFVDFQEAQLNAGRRQRGCELCAVLERNRESWILVAGNGKAGILLEEDRGDESPKLGQLFGCRAGCRFQSSHKGKKLRQWVQCDLPARWTLRKSATVSMPRR